MKKKTVSAICIALAFIMIVTLVVSLMGSFGAFAAGGQEEIDALEKPEDFYACWTILESYEKARGTGIRLNGERKAAFPIKKIPHFDYEGYSFACGNIGDMAYSICAEGEIPPLCIVKPEEFGALILE